MTRYAPPTAPVADAPPPPRSQPPRPVAWANSLIGVIVGLCGIPLFISVGLRRPQTLLPAFALGVVVLLTMLWLSRPLARRRRWARSALLGCFAMVWIQAALDLAPLLAQSALVGGFMIAAIVLQLGVCALLFSGAGARWFAAPAER